MTQTYSAFFAHELKKLIEDQIKERAEILSSGLGIEDFSDYRQKVGVITGLRLVLDDLFSQAADNCDRKER
jgi:hypothetical protein